VRSEVELGAVAGGEHDGLAAVGERARERGGAVEVDGDALAQLDRGAVVGDADERELHDAKWVIGRTTTTSASTVRRRAAARLPRSPVSWRSTSSAAKSSHSPSVTAMAASKAPARRRARPRTM